MVSRATQKIRRDLGIVPESNRLLEILDRRDQRRTMSLPRRNHGLDRHPIGGEIPERLDQRIEPVARDRRKAEASNHPIVAGIRDHRPDPARREISLTIDPPDRAIHRGNRTTVGEIRRLLAVEIALAMEKAKQNGLKLGIAVALFVVALVFVYRSFFGMRIPEDK